MADGLLNHLLNCYANVLDVAVLHAEREARFAVKSALRRIGKQFRERGFYLLNLVGLRRGLHSCLNHGITIATVQINTIRDFWPLAILLVRRCHTCEPRDFFAPARSPSQDADSTFAATARRG